MKTRLLIQEPPLQVLPSLACAIGLNNAIVLQQLHYLLENRNAGVLREGHKWIYNTHQEWREKNFTWWSTKTIQRIFTDLEKRGLVVIQQLDKSDWEMRNYYRIDYQVYEKLEMDTDNLSLSKQTYSPDVKGTHSPDDNNSNTENLSVEGDYGGAIPMDQHERYLFVKQLYAENVTTKIVPIMDQVLIKFSETFENAEWYIPAFKIWISNNVDSWDYLVKIMENWNKNGFGSPAPSFNGKSKGLNGSDAARILQGVNHG